MKIYFIFFTLFLSINSISIYSTRNIIEEVIKKITKHTDYEFGENCITQNFDQILNDIYYSANEYYYSIKEEDKSKFLLKIIFKIVEIINELSNCNPISLDLDDFGFIFALFSSINKVNDIYLKKYWKEIVNIENKLIEAYNEKEFNDSNFGKVLGDFIIEISLFLFNHN